MGLVVKVIKCKDEKSWYYNKVGQVFEVDSVSTREYYIKEKGFNSVKKYILTLDAEIVDSTKNNS